MRMSCVRVRIKHAAATVTAWPGRRASPNMLTGHGAHIGKAYVGLCRGDVATCEAIQTTDDRRQTLVLTVLLPVMNSQTEAGEREMNTPHVRTRFFNSIDPSWRADTPGVPRERFVRGCPSGSAHTSTISACGTSDTKREWYVPT
jgi:hypothetical protein